MKAHATLLQQQSSPATVAPTAAASRPKGLWARLVSRVRSWFEVPYGYEDENGFHYGPQPRPHWLTEPASGETPVFTDRASHAMTYPMALPKLTSEIPAAPTESVASVAKE